MAAALRAAGSIIPTTGTDTLAFNAAVADLANADFAMTLAQATARAGLVEALAEATIRFQSSLDEADWAAQQERRQEIEALDAAMMALAESRREG